MEIRRENTVGQNEGKFGSFSLFKGCKISIQKSGQNGTCLSLQGNVCFQFNENIKEMILDQAKDISF